MPLTARGELRIFIEKSFEKDGETVEYYVAYFLIEDEDGKEDVLVVNTKQDLKGETGKTGDIQVRVGREGKLSLVAFRT